MEIRQVTPPSVLPVSLSEARWQCSLLDGRHDDLLLRLIRASAAYVETHIRAKLCEQTVMFISPEFPEVLPYYPVQAITSVVYLDPDGVSQTVDASDYYITTGAMYPKLTAIGEWPATSDRPDAVKITAVMGFTSTPEDIKAAILIRVKEMFDRRSESVTGMSTSPAFVRIADLLVPHRMLPL